MGWEAVVGAGIGLGGLAGNLITSAKNRRAQSDQNYADRAFQYMLYQQNRSENLADWERMNQYNHPLQQMQRLREAGLNPNLVYGKGADAISGPIRGASSPTSTQPAARFDFDAMKVADSLKSGMLQARQAQLLEAQTAGARSQRALTDAQTAKTYLDEARGSFELRKANALYDTSIESAQKDLEMLKDEVERRRGHYTVDIQAKLIEIETKKLDQAKTRQEIEQIKENIEVLKDEKVIREAKAQLSKAGIVDSSPGYMKALAIAAFNIVKALRRNK